MIEVNAIKTIIGVYVCNFRNPTQQDAIPPIPICKKPINAEALPILVDKEFRASAEALG